VLNKNEGSRRSEEQVLKRFRLQKRPVRSGGASLGAGEVSRDGGSIVGRRLVGVRAMTKPSWQPKKGGSVGKEAKKGGGKGKRDRRGKYAIREGQHGVIWGQGSRVSGKPAAFAENFRSQQQKE